MSDYGWAPYVSVAERRAKAQRAAARARKSGANHSPIEAYRGAVAKTFWGKAWSDNLERYSDYANRLPRGRSYVRNGSVIDLKITAGEVNAQVMGSSLYRVDVQVAAVAAPQWQAIGKDCTGTIDSLVELLQGKLSTAVMQRICTPRTGLFPAPKEISFRCSCPDSAFMCKHIAAVLYGVAARLDRSPELLFVLRQVEARDLVSQARVGEPLAKKGLTAGKRLDTAELADVFGLEMDTGEVRAAPAKRAGAAKKAGAANQAVVAKKAASVASVKTSKLASQKAAAPKKSAMAPKKSTAAARKALAPTPARKKTLG